jgi:hypothetical protein
MTNPADIINYILLNFGIPSARIDSTTKTAAAAVFTGWGLAFNAAFTYQEQRETILARLLCMCRMELVVRDKIYFKVHSAASVKDIQKVDVLQGSFRYRPELESLSDSGSVIYPNPSGDVPVSNLLKALIPAKITMANPSSDQIDASYVYDTQIAQTIGVLELQRRLLPDKQIGMNLKGTCLDLEPDDVVTLKPADYGAGSGKEYDILIDSMGINKDLSISVSCTGFSDVLDDWGDISTSIITVITDATAQTYEAVVAAHGTTGQVVTVDSNGRYVTTNPFGFPIAVAAGSADAITADYTPNLTLTDMTQCAFVASAANATTTPTFSPDGLAAHPIVKKGGVALAAGDIPGALAVCLLEYNAANTRWEFINPASGGASGGHAILEETTPLTARANLSFAGAGVIATDNGSDTTIITIPGGAAAGGGDVLGVQVFS